MDNNIKDSKVVQLRIDDIIPNRFQPREVFDETGLAELADSIREHGVIQPIIVRPIGDKYELIAGERRTKASAMAGLTTIPAIVREMDDNESAKVSLLENLQRRNLSAIEEARTYKRILELDNMTQEQLARTMGKSQPMVANKLRLLALPEEIQDALIKNQISERHARSLLNVKNKEQQLMLLDRIRNERLTVRELDLEIKKLLATNQESLHVDTESTTNKENNLTEREDDKKMNNGNMGGNPYNDFNNNYRSNFGNMGLNDYQSSINNGMFNNLPNMNQNENARPNQFDGNFSAGSTPNFGNTSDLKIQNNNFDYSSFSDPKPYESVTNQVSNENTPFQQPNIPTNTGNFNSLGSMFDGNQATNYQPVNDFNSEAGPDSSGNHFISQIKESPNNSQMNQFLPNFEESTAGNFNNQTSFDSEMNNFNQPMNNFANNNFNNNDFPTATPFNDVGTSTIDSNYSAPINDFSFPSLNKPQYPFDDNRQGGLFNDLNIVNVPNDSNQENPNSNSESRFKSYDESPLSEPMSNPDNNFSESSNNSNNSVWNSFPQDSAVNPKDESDNSTNFDDNEAIDSSSDNQSSDNYESEKETSTSSPTPLETKKEYIRLDPVTTIFDTRGAVLELKKTTDRIKQNKIKIDTEEIEYDDYYQIIIKIKK